MSSLAEQQVFELIQLKILMRKPLKANLLLLTLIYLMSLALKLSVQTKFVVIIPIFEQIAQNNSS